MQSLLMLQLLALHLAHLQSLEGCNTRLRLWGLTALSHSPLALVPGHLASMAQSSCWLWLVVVPVVEEELRLVCQMSGPVVVVELVNCGSIKLALSIRTPWLSRLAKVVELSHAISNRATLEETQFLELRQSGEVGQEQQREPGMSVGMAEAAVAEAVLAGPLRGDPLLQRSEWALLGHQVMDLLKPRVVAAELEGQALRPVGKKVEQVARD
jgi:hypothetical protein